jgi:signal transduction histidine kinase
MQRRTLARRNRARDGRLWFPTQDGAAVIDPRGIEVNAQSPPVVIETVKIDNNDAVFDKENSKIQIEPAQQNFEIAYTALSFINSENLRFKYKLEGLDDEWIDAGTRRLAYFSHVPPGAYTFRVIAANSDNVWNEQGATLKIVVLPPFYRTWLFLILTVFVIAAIVYLLVRRRFNQLEKERLAQADFSRRLINAHETERRRVAGELHDSIGQSLAMIKNSAVFGGQMISSVADAKEHLAEISGASAQAISEVREIAYNLRPFMLDRLGLTKAISSLLNKIADHSALKIISEIENIDGIFESDAEISVYRIIQECLNNIMKHSEAREVKVKITKRERRVLIKISDNGVGFDIKTRQNEKDGRDGFGLIGMTERVRILGGTFEVNSAIGEGTTIQVEIWKHK